MSEQEENLNAGLMELGEELHSYMLNGNGRMTFKEVHEIFGYNTSMIENLCLASAGLIQFLQDINEIALLGDTTENELMRNITNLNAKKDAIVNYITMTLKNRIKHGEEPDSVINISTARKAESETK